MRNLMATVGAMLCLGVALVLSAFLWREAVHPEVTPAPEKAMARAVCDRCGGKGYVTAPVSLVTPSAGTMKMICSECEGKGYRLVPAP